MIKTFFYVEVIGALAVIRLFSAIGASRWLAFATVVIAATGTAAKYVPPLAGLTGTEIGRTAAMIVNQGVITPGSGMALPILTSAVFALSWRAKGQRWWLLDALHLICAISFFGLWIYTQL